MNDDSLRYVWLSLRYLWLSLRYVWLSLRYAWLSLRYVWLSLRYIWLSLRYVGLFLPKLWLSLRYVGLSLHYYVGLFLQYVWLTITDKCSKQLRISCDAVLRSILRYVIVIGSKLNARQGKKAGNASQPHISSLIKSLTKSGARPARPQHSRQTTLTAWKNKCKEFNIDQEGHQELTYIQGPMFDIFLKQCSYDNAILLWAFYHHINFKMCKNITNLVQDVDLVTKIL